MRVVAEVVNATRIAYGRKRRRQGAPLPALSRSRGRRRLSQEVRRDRATASLDNTAGIWDTVTANEIAVLRGHDNYVYSAAFSPDGSRIVTASWDKTARIWDVASAKEIGVLRGHDNYVLAAAFSPDGSRIGHGVRGQDCPHLGCPCRDHVGERPAHGSVRAPDRLVAIDARRNAPRRIPGEQTADRRMRMSIQIFCGLPETAVVRSLLLARRGSSNSIRIIATSSFVRWCQVPDKTTDGGEFPLPPRRPHSTQATALRLQAFGV